MYLLYGARPYVDEGLDDYIARLAYWNGFVSDRKFILTLLRVGKTLDEENHYVTNNCCAAWYRCRDILCYLINYDLSLLQLSSGCGTSPFRTSKFVDWSKICVKCWQEEQYFRVFWRIDDYRVCHLHNTSLVDSDGFYSEMDRIRHSDEPQVNQDESCLITTRAVKIFRTEHDSVWKIFFERWKIAYLSKVLEKFGWFIKRYFNTSLRLYPIRKMLTSGRLVGRIPSRQLEDMSIMLCRGKSACETRGLIFILVLMIKSVTFRPFNAKRSYVFEEWADGIILNSQSFRDAYRAVGADKDQLRIQCESLFKELDLQFLAEKARVEIVKRIQISTSPAC